MRPINFYCVVSYMASVYKISDELDEKTIRKEARVTLRFRKNMGLLEYKLKGLLFLFLPAIISPPTARPVSISD